MYYRYQSRLLEILSSKGSSELRSSLRAQYESSRVDLASSSLPSALVDLSAVIPIPFADAVPLEIWKDIFNVMTHCVCLVSHHVCWVWCAWLTFCTHTHLVLSLPDGCLGLLRSHVLANLLVFHKFASMYELNMCSMIVFSSLHVVVCGVHYSNWPFSPHNCFPHLWENLEVGIIKGTASLNHDCIPPTVPSTFLFPATVKKLCCSKVSFKDYSLEGCLSPAGHLERLTVEGIDAGHLVSYFHLLIYVASPYPSLSSFPCSGSMEIVMCSEKVLALPHFVTLTCSMLISPPFNTWNLIFCMMCSNSLWNSSVAVPTWLKMVSLSSINFSTLMWCLLGGWMLGKPFLCRPAHLHWWSLIYV